MSTVSSSSTLAQVEAAYDDNASYEEDRSAAKCRAFMTAARILLRRLPAESRTPQTALVFRMESIEKELARAQTWLDANDTGTTGTAPSSRVTKLDFRNSL